MVRLITLIIHTASNKQKELDVSISPFFVSPLVSICGKYLSSAQQLS